MYKSNDKMLFIAYVINHFSSSKTSKNTKKGEARIATHGPGNKG